MNLSPYLDTVRTGVVAAAGLADEATQRMAAQLATALESTTRLALIQALSDAAGTISAELAPASVEVRMAGPDPEFVLSVPPAVAEPALLTPAEEPAGDEAEPEDEPQARVTLRLPNSIKARVDELADQDGISTNAWLMRAVLEALPERQGRRWRGGPGRGQDGSWAAGPPPIPTPPPRPGSPIVGASFGPGGAWSVTAASDAASGAVDWSPHLSPPQSPGGAGGPEGPWKFFGPNGPLRRSRPGSPERRPDDHGGDHGEESHGASGGVQGWVR